MISYSRMASVFALLGAVLGSAAAIAESTLDEIGERITDRLPGFVVSSLMATEVQGLFEVVSDGRIYYIDESAEYLIDGSLIRLEDRLNVTDSRL
ncbi:MAG: thiol:disulfide interchange protein DsbC, partial [Porticoccaceae bacterium]